MQDLLILLLITLLFIVCTAASFVAGIHVSKRGIEKIVQEKMEEQKKDLEAQQQYYYQQQTSSLPVQTGTRSHVLQLYTPHSDNTGVIRRNISTSPFGSTEYNQRNSFSESTIDCKHTNFCSAGPSTSEQTSTGQTDYLFTASYPTSSAMKPISSQYYTNSTSPTSTCNRSDAGTTSWNKPRIHYTGAASKERESKKSFGGTPYFSRVIHNK